MIHWEAFADLFKNIWSDIQSRPIFAIVFFAVLIVAIIVAKKSGKSFGGVIVSAFGILLFLFIIKQFNSILVWVILGIAVVFAIIVTIMEEK